MDEEYGSIPEVDKERKARIFTRRDAHDNCVSYWREE